MTNKTVDGMCVSGANKNAVAKLNILFRDRIRYCDLAETPIHETSFTAFTVAVSVDGRHYVGVGKTKKAARNAAAERALVSKRLWTNEDEQMKLAAMVDLDEDPVEAVHRMQEAIAQRREMKNWERQGGWNEYPPPHRDVPRGGMARGRGRWNMAGPGWEDDYSDWGDDRYWDRGETWDSPFQGDRDDRWDGPFHGDPGDRWEGPFRDNRGDRWDGPFQGDHDDRWDGSFHRDRGGWSDRGPRGRGRGQNQSVPSLFGDLRGRSDAVRGGGFRGRGGGGGTTLETFRRNTDSSNTSNRGSRGKDGWNRSVPAERGRGGSGMARSEKPLFPQSLTPKLTPTSSGFLSKATTSTPAASAPAYPPVPNPPPPPVSAPPVSLSNFVVDPATGIYYPSTNQNQASVPSANQTQAQYMATGMEYYMGGLAYQNMGSNMTFAGSSATGYVPPGSHEQTATQTNTMPSYGAYAGTGYGSMYGQGWP